MKVHVYKKGIDVILTVEKLATESPIIDGIYNYLGEHEMEVVKPKKMVMKEIKIGEGLSNIEWPASAKNVRILYEVEEEAK